MAESENRYGVIEGFYGRPWSSSERDQLLEWMGEWGGLNTYMYAPKDDLYHRSKWRDPYPESYQIQLGELIQSCSKRDVRFIYGIAPGLDMAYASDAEFELLTRKIAQMIDLGCSHFALLFDDIPETLPEDATDRYSSFGQAHCDVANRLNSFLTKRLSETSLSFCPTPYCGRLAGMNVRCNEYLNEVGELLEMEIDVFWTGPEVVSETITVESIREIAEVIKRKPVVWDNLHANDYDMLRFYTGPYQGRSSELKSEVKGILSNPNTPFWPNYIPLRTFSEYVTEDGFTSFLSFEDAIRDFSMLYSIPQESLEAFELLCSCYYLPYEFGSSAEKFLNDIQFMLDSKPEDWLDKFTSFEKTHKTVQQLLVDLNSIETREKLYSIYHILWEFRESLFLIEGVLKSKKEGKENSFQSPYHFEALFRGGFSDRLTSQLLVKKDGTVLQTDKKTQIE